MLTYRDSWWRIFAAILVVALGVALTQCNSGSIDLTGRQCPCVSGYVCDPATNTCVSSTTVDGNLDATVGADVPSTGADAEAPAPDACAYPACACRNDADCKADETHPRCAPDGTCVQCLTTSDNCPPLEYCVTGNVCAAGCKTNAECASAPQGDAGAPKDLCNTTRRECVECILPSDCPVNMLCTPAGACVQGCDLDAGKACTGGRTCCNFECIDTQNDPYNCNGCGTTCGGASPACCGGTCVDRYASPSNCGGCGVLCSSVHATPGCSLGVCTPTCNAGYGHCVSGNTGCETSTSGNPAHCGSCATDCSATEQNVGGVSCANGTCGYTSCNSGYGNCDGIASNGCETNLSNTPTACGSCSTNCLAQVVNATGVTCSGGSCTFGTCASGYGDCDGNRANGCECSCGHYNQACCPPNNTCTGGNICVSGTCQGD